MLHSRAQYDSTRFGAAPRRGSLPHRVLLLLTLVLATLATQQPAQPVILWLPWTLLLAIVAEAARAQATRYVSSLDTPRPDRRIVICVAAALLAAILLPPFLDAATRDYDKHWTPLEQALLSGLRNALLVCWPLSVARRFENLAVGLASFVVCASVMICEDPWVMPLALGCVASACWWLAERYWSVARPAPSHATGPTPRLPLFICISAVVLVGWAGGRVALDAPAILGEWLPASGGTREYNNRALLGIADGDWAVAGKNASTTGSIDSDQFLESNLPTIYDVFNEAYGEPMKPRESYRAISVAPPETNETAGARPQTARTSREFTLLRDRSAKKRRTAETRDDALLHVVGRTPLHLAMRVYDRFDGRTWHEATDANTVCRLENRTDDLSWQWLSTTSPPTAEPHAAERHTLKFGEFRTDRLPMPPHVERFRLGKLVAAGTKQWALETFRFAAEGLLRLRRDIPPGFYLETVSHVLARHRLHRANVSHDPSTCAACSVYLQIPPALVPTAEKYAATWRDQPCGWCHIETVVTALRTHFVHDRDAPPNPECADPVHEFLFETRRGPDYQFATAAALALRSLGYPTRVVSGLYASPAKFDRGTGTTPIRSDDAHFWVEVRLPDGTWAAVEPTPGYELLQPRWTFAGVFSRAWESLAAVAQERPISTAAAIVLISFAIAHRRRIGDAIDALRWRVRRRRDARAEAVYALAILERRARRLRWSRAVGVTVKAWLASAPCKAVGEEAERLRTDLGRFASAYAKAVYGPPSPNGSTPSPTAEAEAVERVVLRWRYDALRRVMSGETPHASR